VSLADDLRAAPLPAAAIRALGGGEGAWIAGGAVRDAALGREVADLDLAVAGDPQNPAKALARELAALWDLPVAALLSRREPARPQRGLSRAERRRNVRGSFTVVTRPPTRVALVDDVYTTGATVSAAATELRRSGARSVHVVTFARTVRR